MPDLDQHLAAARQDLLARIRVAELDQLRARARTLRRRRVVVSALAVVMVLAGTGMALAGRGWLTTTAVDVAASPSAQVGSQWRGGGLTVLGLNGAVLDVAGQLHAVEFADRLLGYALLADCRFDDGRVCATTIAVTSDAGRTWSTPGWLESPFAQVSREQLPSLITVGSRAVLVSPDSAWVSDRAHGFTRTGIRDGQADGWPAGARPWVRGGAGERCEPGPVQVWLPDGWQARLATQPPMQVCRVAPAPTASGAWWVGGRVGDRPAVGVSRDDGRSWQVTPLPAHPGAWAEVSTLGGDVFATAVSPRGGNPYPETLSVWGVYRSAGEGPFTPYLDPTGATLIGQIVPLLDGGLVAAGPGWRVSPGPGRAFTSAGGSLPFVYQLRRTPGGWVADNLFGDGWAAISVDGATWQKINIR